MGMVREKVVEAVRFLGKETRRGRTHRCFLLVNYIFKHEVAVISGVTGEITRADWQKLFDAMRADGCERIRSWRPNSRSVPRGVLIRKGEYYSEWEVDITDAQQDPHFTAHAAQAEE